VRIFIKCECRLTFASSWPNYVYATIGSYIEPFLPALTVQPILNIAPSLIPPRKQSRFDTHAIKEAEKGGKMGTGTKQLRANVNTYLPNDRPHLIFGRPAVPPIIPPISANSRVTIRASEQQVSGHRSSGRLGEPIRVKTGLSPFPLFPPVKFRNPWLKIPMKNKNYQNEPTCSAIRIMPFQAIPPYSTGYPTRPNLQTGFRANKTLDLGLWRWTTIAPSQVPQHQRQSCSIVPSRARSQWPVRTTGIGFGLPQNPKRTKMRPDQP